MMNIFKILIGIIIDLFPPHIIYEMKKQINKLLKKEEYELDFKIKYKSINKLIKESEEFLLSIKNKSDEIKKLICNFTTNLEIVENKNKIWMIITNDPIKNLQNNDQKENIEDLLEEF